jgi:hypothetical protein
MYRRQFKEINGTVVGTFQSLMKDESNSEEQE